MFTDEITKLEADVEAVREELHAAREAGEVPAELVDRWRIVQGTLAAARSAWKAQEEAAGRRVGLVGGDAVKVEE